MSLRFPKNHQTIWQSNLPATPSNTAIGTTVTASSTINTKGSYSQLIAAATYDSYGFWLGIFGVSTAATDTSQLLDIAIGAAASEVDILSNFLTGSRSSTVSVGGPTYYFIPLFSPAGSRVAARVQGVISSDTAVVSIMLNGGHSQIGPIFNCCDTYGADTADSGGTAHTPGNSGSESTDATIGTATRDYGAIMLGLSSNLTVAANLATHWELTDGTNTLAEWLAFTTTAENVVGPFPLAPFYLNIPNGMAMQVQAECSGTGEAMDAAFYCFY